MIMVMVLIVDNLADYDEGDVLDDGGGVLMLDVTRQSILMKLIAPWLMW